MNSFFPMELKLSNGNVLYFTRYCTFDQKEIVVDDSCINCWFLQEVQQEVHHVILKSWDDCVDYMKRFDMRGFEVRMDYGSYNKLDTMEMKNIGLEENNRTYPKYPFSYTLVFKIEYEELDNITKTVFVTTANGVKTMVKLAIN